MVEVVEEAEHGELREAPLPSRSSLVRGLVCLIVIGALLPTAFGFAGRVSWLLDLCNHFRFQCVLVLLVTTVCLLLLHSWRLAGVSLAGLVLNAVLVLPLYLGSPGQSLINSPTLTVMHFNVNTANRDHAGVIAEIQSHAPDLLFVQEVNQAWLGTLQAGLPSYELIASEPRSDNFGIACFIRTSDDERNTVTITGSRVFDPTNGFAQVPVIEVALDWDGQTVHVLCIHPPPPVSDEYAQWRDAVMDAAGKWAAKQTTPCIIVGDFNATPWSTAFRDLQAAGSLINSQVGFGRAPTWPSGLGSLGMIPIDHLLHSGDFVTIDRHIGEAHGSDHQPLIVTLGWRQETQQAE